jgi:hypothetical protein
LGIGFVSLTVVYDVIKWRYKRWPNSPTITKEKVFLKICHAGLLIFLFGTPLMTIGAYALGDQAPGLLDKLVVSSADKAVTDKIPAFGFVPSGPRKPENEGVAYVGVARSGSAVLFESKSILNYATRTAFESMTSFAGVLLLLCLVAVIFFAFAELVFESQHLAKTSAAAGTVPPGNRP